MNSYEISAIIESELPRVGKEIKRHSGFGNPYRVMATLSRFAQQLLLQHDLPSVVKCLQVTDKIYAKGTSLVKNAVENVFVFSFTSLQAGCNKMEWKVIEAKMPETLISIYRKQLRSREII